jgi:hypothetical protein
MNTIDFASLIFYPTDPTQRHHDASADAMWRGEIVMMDVRAVGGRWVMALEKERGGR